MNGEEILYVGQSNNVRRRVKEHIKSDKIVHFNHNTKVRVIECTDNEHMNKLEKRLISDVKPRLNTTHISLSEEIDCNIPMITESFYMFSENERCLMMHEENERKLIEIEKTYNKFKVSRKVYSDFIEREFVLNNKIGYFIDIHSYHCQFMDITFSFDNIKICVDFNLNFEELYNLDPITYTKTINKINDIYKQYLASGNIEIKNSKFVNHGNTYTCSYLELLNQ